MNRKWVRATACILMASLIMGGCAGVPFGKGKKKPGSGEPEKEVLSVEVEMAKKKELVISETFVGTVSAAEEVTIYPTASGKIVALNVAVGDRVEAGQQLFKIDDESARLSLRSAQAGLESAQASANQALGGSETLKEAQEQQNIDALTRSQSTVDRSLQDAKENVDRGKRKLDEAKDDRSEAEDDYEDAKEKYSLAKDYQEDWEDLQSSEPAFLGATLAEAAAMTASYSVTTTDSATGQTYTTTTKGPTEAHLQEAKNLLSDLQDDDLGVTDITTNGLNALKTSRDSLKDAYTAKKRAVETAEDSVEDLRRAVESQKDAQTNADASLDSAEANRAVTDGQILEDTKRVLNAQVNSSSAGVAQAQYALDQYVSKSPITGTVDLVNIHLHDTIGPSTAALVVSNKDTLKITFSVPEKVRNNLSTGQGVKITKDGKKLKGLITQVGESIDSATGLFKIEAAVTGDGSLLNGTTVTVKVDSYRDDSGIVIPYDAVYYANGEPYVYVADEGTAKRRDVGTGMFNKKNIVISEGLNVGEQVITSWSADLRDGALVEVASGEDKEGKESEETPEEEKTGEGATDNGKAGEK